MILDTKLKFPFNLVFFEEDYDNVWWCSRKKRRRPRVQKCHFTIVEKLAFFPKGLTQDFGKKMKFLLSIFFLQKWLHMLFDGIVARKEGFVAYKNVI